jgi:hypothetical protein
MFTPVMGPARQVSACALSQSSDFAIGKKCEASQVTQYRLS